MFDGGFSKVLAVGSVKCSAKGSAEGSAASRFGKLAFRLGSAHSSVRRDYFLVRFGISSVRHFQLSVRPSLGSSAARYWFGSALSFFGSVRQGFGSAFSLFGSVRHLRFGPAVRPFGSSAHLDEFGSSVVR